ncbi:MAG: hypothetical protein RLN90_09555 [Balneolaceae bacterium]
MPEEVNEDFKRYLDEKFNNLNEKIDKALRFESRINKLEAENSTLKEQLNSRPTIFQMVTAAGAVLTLSIGIATLIFQIIK